MRPIRSLALAFALVAPLLVPFAASRAAEDASAGDGLTARQIYDKVLANRFDAFRQEVRLVSGDRAENAQEARMNVLWKSFRDEADQPTNGVFSKSMIRYTHPFDLRFSGYLIINNADRGDDQFVYLASRRRVRRVNLRGEPVLGSDFSFEDVVPREIEDAEYVRLPDETWDGRVCQVVEIVPSAASDSAYSKMRSWIDPDRSVVLRTLYWDRDGVQVKELRAPSAEVRFYDPVWIPMHAEMRNLLSESWSRFTIDSFEPNPALDAGAFDLRRLESH